MRTKAVRKKYKKNSKKQYKKNSKKQNAGSSLEKMQQQLDASLFNIEKQLKKKTKRKPKLIALDFDETITIIGFFQFLGLSKDTNYIDDVFGGIERLELKGTCGTVTRNTD